MTTEKPSLAAIEHAKDPATAARMIDGLFSERDRLQDELNAMTRCAADRLRQIEVLRAQRGDLLAACEAVLGYVDADYWTGSGLQVRNALWMAIAKAKGK